MMTTLRQRTLSTKVHRVMVQAHFKFKTTPMLQYMHGFSVPRMQQKAALVLMGLRLLFALGYCMSCLCSCTREQLMQQQAQQKSSQQLHWALI